MRQGLNSDNAPDCQSVPDEPETPWFDTCVIDPKGEPCIQCDKCFISFLDADEHTVPLMFSGGGAVSDFLTAHAKLVGPFWVGKLLDAEGKELPMSHVIQVGQHVQVGLSSPGVGVPFGVHICHDLIGPHALLSGDVDMVACGQGLNPTISPEPAPIKLLRESGPLPKLPVGIFMRESGPLPKLPVGGVPGESGPLPKLPDGDVRAECGPLPRMPAGALDDKPENSHNACVEAALKPRGVPDSKIGCEGKPLSVDPTATWTHPCCAGPDADMNDGSNQGLTCDVGVCSVVGPVNNGAWGAADSLLALDSHQFLNLLVPCVADLPRLHSLRQQFIRGTDRLQLLGKHQELWADDEIRFHLYSMQQAFLKHPKTSPCPGLIIIDPLVASAWIQNRAFACEQWAAAHPEVRSQSLQVIMVVRLEKHWIPVQFVPIGQHVNVFTWDAPDNSHDELNGMIEKLVMAWGFSTFLIHRQQRMFFSSRLCGALAVHYIQHVLFGTQLPTAQDEAFASHTKLRDRFVACLSQNALVMRPWLWGHGDDEETEREWPSSPPSPDQSPVTGAGAAASSSEIPFASDSNRLLSTHLCISLDDRLDLMKSHGRDLADDEIRFHLNVLVDQHNASRHMSAPASPYVWAFDCLNFWNWDDVGHILTEKWCRGFPSVREESQQIVTVMHVDDHWLPFWLVPGGRVLVAHTFNDWVDWDIVEGKIRWMGLHLGFEDTVIHRVPNGLPDHRLCGPHALAFLAHILLRVDLPETITELEDMFTGQRASFVQENYADRACRCPIIWGAGGSGALIKSLSDELLRHGVPAQLTEARASQAIKAIGSEQLVQALQHKQPWRQLKALGNNVNFKFVLPSELAVVVENNKSKPVGKKSSREKPSPGIPAPIEIDPAKLQVLEGTFRSQGQVLPQLSPQQIGPLSSGYVLMSLADAEPYLTSGKQVSQEPLALVVFHRRDVTRQSMLPQTQCTVPCRCTLDNEPILAEATLVQVVSGPVEKWAGSDVIAVDSPDVCTVKISVFQDEFGDSWETFCKAPIRGIVGMIPELKRCMTTGCTCPAWHNEEGIPIREPILDLWKRQFLKFGFKQAEAGQADFFCVSMRVPVCLLDKVLHRSGHLGVYVEPRTADGKEVMDDFMVIWMPKHSLQSLHHTRQTNPAVVGLARVGDRRGLRVPTSQAHEVHKIVRPDTLFLPPSTRTQYTAGPFPFGLDRQGISKAMKQVGWDCKPLQPAAPQPGKGAMWVIQAVDPPPNTIVLTSHGEVVISKHKSPEQPARGSVSVPVASPATLALCGQPQNGSVDPWLKQDPWGSYAPVSKTPVVNVPAATDSLHQMESRIQRAVLAKMPQSMEDDVPDRISTLETQVQHLLTKQTHMESQFGEFSAQQTQQVSLLQSQVNANAQQVHGQLEQQNQSIQAMFETQLTHIRGLLSKRTREDGE